METIDHGSFPRSMWKLFVTDTCSNWCCRSEVASFGLSTLSSLTTKKSLSSVPPQSSRVREALQSWRSFVNVPSTWIRAANSLTSWERVTYPRNVTSLTATSFVGWHWASWVNVKKTTRHKQIKSNVRIEVFCRLIIKAMLEIWMTFLMSKYSRSRKQCFGFFSVKKITHFNSHYLLSQKKSMKTKKGLYVYQT